MYLFFDTETTGLPKRWNAPVTDVDNWPRLVQLAWIVYDDQGQIMKTRDVMVRPEGFTIPFEASRVHGITTAIALEKGWPIQEVMEEFADFKKSKTLHGLIIEINALEEEGDRMFIDSMRKLHTEVKDPIEIIAWREIYVYLEKCCDACEHVADIVESVIMKNT